EAHGAIPDQVVHEAPEGEGVHGVATRGGARARADTEIHGNAGFRPQTAIALHDRGRAVQLRERGYAHVAADIADELDGGRHVVRHAETRRRLQSATGATIPLHRRT